jgi:hypothetical protein
VVPIDTPVIIPDVRPTVAIVRSLLLQVPPDNVPLLNVTEWPVHTELAPVSGKEAGSTVKVTVALQPVLSV